MVLYSDKEIQSSECMDVEEMLVGRDPVFIYVSGVRAHASTKTVPTKLGNIVEISHKTSLSLIR